MNEYTPPKLERMDDTLDMLIRALLEMRNIFYQMEKELRNILEKHNGEMSNP